MLKSLANMSIQVLQDEVPETCLPIVGLILLLGWIVRMLMSSGHRGKRPRSPAISCAEDDEQIGLLQAFSPRDHCAGHSSHKADPPTFGRALSLSPDTVCDRVEAEAAAPNKEAEQAEAAAATKAAAAAAEEAAAKAAMAATAKASAEAAARAEAVNAAVKAAAARAAEEATVLKAAEVAAAAKAAEEAAAAKAAEEAAAVKAAEEAAIKAAVEAVAVKAAAVKAAEEAAVKAAEEAVALRAAEEATAVKAAEEAAIKAAEEAAALRAAEEAAVAEGAAAEEAAAEVAAAEEAVAEVAAAVKAAAEAAAKAPRSAPVKSPRAPVKSPRTPVTSPLAPVKSPLAPVKSPPLKRQATSVYDSRLYEAFCAVDTDGTGELSKRQLYAALAQVGLAVTPSEQLSIWTSFDRDASGRIEWPEFNLLGVALLEELEPTKAIVKRARRGTFAVRSAPDQLRFGRAAARIQGLARQRSADRLRQARGH